LREKIALAQCRYGIGAEVGAEVVAVRHIARSRAEHRTATEHPAWIDISLNVAAGRCSARSTTEAELAAEPSPNARAVLECQNGPCGCAGWWSPGASTPAPAAKILKHPAPLFGLAHDTDRQI